MTTGITVFCVQTVLRLVTYIYILLPSCLVLPLSDHRAEQLDCASFSSMDSMAIYAADSKELVVIGIVAQILLCVAYMIHRPAAFKTTYAGTTQSESPFKTKLHQGEILLNSYCLQHFV